jgi:O-antigen/teichoic acid export membrane protein
MAYLATIKNNIKFRLGELWWYTIIMLMIQQLGSVINAFIGLWLVPKYVPQTELGAVLPLAQVGSVLGLPLAILLIPFGKFLNVYAARGEFGKVKSLLRDVFLLAAVVGIGIAVVAQYLMPLVYERMRVQSGMLTWLIVLTGLTSTLAPLFYQALQALKKFKQISIVGLLSAPVRLIVLLVTLPIRGLSGYFAGQLIADGFGIIFSLVSLRELFSRKVPSMPYLHHWKEIVQYTLPIAVLLSVSRLQGMAECFVIRHRLPDVESAAYYFITRFAEIPICLWAAVSIVFFPVISERHETGEKSYSLLKQSMFFVFIGGGLITLALCLVTPLMFAAVPAWVQYVPYAPLMGIASATSVVRATFACFVAYEMACRRFGFVLYAIFFYILETVVLYGVSGITYFDNWLPAFVVSEIESANLMRLSVVVWTIFGFAIFLLGCACIQLFWPVSQEDINKSVLQDI